MPNQSVNSARALTMLPLESFGVMQERYQSLSLSHRAKTIIEDASPALQIAQALLATLSKNSKLQLALSTIRSNTLLIERMRPSQAKQVLVEGKEDFIATTENKLMEWRKTIERVANGEGVVHGREDFIPETDPMATAVMNLHCVGSYLSIVQLALAELAKLDNDHADSYESSITKIRRCATFLSDCALASSICASVH